MRFYFESSITVSIFTKFFWKEKSNKVVKFLSLHLNRHVTSYSKFFYITINGFWPIKFGNSYIFFRILFLNFLFKESLSGLMFVMLLENYFFFRFFSCLVLFFISFNWSGAALIRILSSKFSNVCLTFSIWKYRFLDQFMYDGHNFQEMMYL